MFKKGNKILKIDDLSDIERERRKKSGGGPLKGYYRAMLLDLQTSEGNICCFMLFFHLKLELTQKLSRS